MIKISNFTVFTVILSTALGLQTPQCIASHKTVKKTVVPPVSRANQKSGAAAIQRTAAAQAAQKRTVASKPHSAAGITKAAATNAQRKTQASKQQNNNADHLFALQLSQEINGNGGANAAQAVAKPKALPKNVQLLKATQQKGNSCGNHALHNAWAIQELHKAGSAITADSIAKKTAEIAHLLPEKAEFLELQDIITRINNDILDVQSLYFLTYKDETVSEAGMNEREKMTMHECIQNLKVSANACCFFICHIPAHWFLIPVVKKNNQTQILVLDSQNAQLDAARNAHIDFVSALIA